MPMTKNELVDLICSKNDQLTKKSSGEILDALFETLATTIRKDTKYREASTATVSVLDRNGRKLGTMYLGQMPEPGQKTLSEQLTALIDAVLTQWQGPLPRLEYVTDGGHHPTDYFEKVLLNKIHPRTGVKLQSVVANSYSRGVAS